MMSQRWKRRREYWRPPGECVETRKYEIAAIERRPAKEFVETHHYSGSFVADRMRYGLFRGEQLVGVCVFSEPMPTVLKPFHGAPACELGRFVLLDPEPSNAESFFLAECFRRMRRAGFHGVVSFSDPTPRLDEQGEVIHPGHVGTIYQACSAIYTGRGTPRTLKMLPDGRVLNDRSLQKIRAFERGWRAYADKLVARGAAPLEAGEDSRAWLRYWVPRLTRPVRHQGNHRYLFAFSHFMRKRLPPSLPYPKLDSFAIMA